MYVLMYLLYIILYQLNRTILPTNPVSSHLGIRYKTGIILNRKEYFPIRDHIINCKADINIYNFKILNFFGGKASLKFLEFIYIKIQKPTLNYDVAAITLIRIVQKFTDFNFLPPQFIQNVNFVFTRCVLICPFFALLISVLPSSLFNKYFYSFCLFYFNFNYLKF